MGDSDDDYDVPLPPLRVVGRLRSRLEPLEEQMSEQPIEPDKHEAMNAIAQVLCDIFPDLGFALLVFEFGDKGRMNYISNTRRQEMLIAMKEFISRNEFGDQPETKQ